MFKMVLHLFLSFTLIIFFLFFPCYRLQSQVQYGGTPVTILTGVSGDDIDVLNVSLTDEMFRRMSNYSFPPEPGEALHAGFSLPAGVGPSCSGSWDLVGDSLQIWRLKISSPGALALGLVFDDFKLPENARMFVYSVDKQFIVGAFDSRNNNAHNVFTSHIIPADAIVIEYELNIERGVSDIPPESPFNIRDVIHITRGGGLFSDGGRPWGLGNSGWCQIDINCPEGDDWQNHKRSVARMLMKVGGDYWWCTGALVNNTAKDTTPYLLSAAHCGTGADFQDMIYWQFYFNFERPGCQDTVGTPAYDMLHGCDLVSKGPLDGGSDFRLVLLKKSPPAGWNPYFSGWSVSESPSNSGVGIHHPAGDTKKISTYSTTLTSATVKVNDSKMAENSAWRVEWESTETNWSVPEGGSSGSPLFNSQGLIVGTLTGGTSDCYSPQKPDFYGKMSYHWESNDPDNVMKQLKPYLDPLNKGVMTLQGFDPYYTEYPPPGYLTTKDIDGESIELKWHKPGSTPNTEGWYSHVTDYTHLTWKGPERATLFDDKDFDFTFPLILEKVSGIFAEHQNHQWPDNKFRFKIYGHDGKALLYESPLLYAEDLQESQHILSNPLEIDEKFYVAVKPVHESGHPSTLMKMVNYGAGHSFTGIPGEWFPYMDIQKTEQFDFLIKIYITDQDGRSSKATIKQAKTDHRALEESEITETESLSLNNNYAVFYEKYENTPLYYRLYRDNEMIFQSATAQVTTFTDNVPGFGFYEYHATAVYEGMIESDPSNAAYVLLDEPCDTYISEFPFQEIFEDGKLDECWKKVEKSAYSWQFTTGYPTDNGNVNPVEGDYFIYVPGTDEETQDEWLITAPVDFSSASRPALRFHFNGSYTSSVIEGNCSLRAYVSVDGGAFHEVWNHTMHPGFDSPQTDYQWLKTSVNLIQFANEGNVRIAFQYEGKNGENFAIDKIELLDAAMLYFVSLEVKPELSGMATGQGLYMEGEPVTVKAEPDIGYVFKKWEKNNELFSTEQEYTFTMPSNSLSLSAIFTSVLPVDDQTMPSGYLAGYPNPARNRYNVLFSKPMKNVVISVMNLQGSRLALYNYDIIEADERVSINLTGLSKGVYLINVVSDDYHETLKVTIID